MTSIPQEPECSGGKNFPPEHPVVGLDGKRYPRYDPQEVRDYIFGRSHWLRHEEGLSVRQIVRALADEGHRRSVGSVAAYLKAPCTKCSGEAKVSPEHQGGEQ